MFKKIILFSFIAVGVITSLYLIKKSSNTKILIAITQIAPHPSLDQIHKGIVDTLKKIKNMDIEIVFQNAQGNIATATQIAQRFVSLKPNVIVAITTPSAQTVHAAASSKHIPLVFVAVTDPIEARLATPHNTNIPFVTGVSDAPPYAAQIKQMQKILGKKTFTLGVIHNPGEPNSISQIKYITEEITRCGGNLILSSAPSTVAVGQATSQLIEKVDAIYLPNDNTVVSALTSVLKITHKHKVPVFSSDPESVELGCTATIAPNQYAIGEQAGKIIIRLLNGEKTDDIPIEKCTKIDEYVNKNAELHMALGSPQH